MDRAPRKLAFVIAGTDQGTMIVNRFDYHQRLGETGSYGVGFDLLNGGRYEPNEVTLVVTLLGLRRRYFGDGVVAVDCGANLGILSLEWAKEMTGWGSVLAIEAQERLYYALCGNIAIANCSNMRAIEAVVGSRIGLTLVPMPDYLSPGSFGSVEMVSTGRTDDVGQLISYAAAHMVRARAITIDSLELKRLDFLKIDVEGMEIDVLEGASGTLAACRPIILVEWLKSDLRALTNQLIEMGYQCVIFGKNIIAFDPSDPTGPHITAAEQPWVEPGHSQ